MSSRTDRYGRALGVLCDLSDAIDAFGTVNAGAPTLVYSAPGAGRRLRIIGVSVTNANAVPWTGDFTFNGGAITKHQVEIPANTSQCWQFQVPLDGGINVSFEVTQTSAGAGNSAIHICGYVDPPTGNVPST